MNCIFFVSNICMFVCTNLMKNFGEINQSLSYNDWIRLCGHVIIMRSNYICKLLVD